MVKQTKKRLTDPSEAVRVVSSRCVGYSAFGMAPYAAVSGASSWSKVLIPSLKLNTSTSTLVADRARPSSSKEGFLRNNAYNILGDNYMPVVSELSRRGGGGAGVSK